MIPPRPTTRSLLLLLLLSSLLLTATSAADTGTTPLGVRWSRSAESASFSANELTASVVAGAPGGREYIWRIAVADIAHPDGLQSALDFTVLHNLHALDSTVTDATTMARTLLRAAGSPESVENYGVAPSTDPRHRVWTTTVPSRSTGLPVMFHYMGWSRHGLASAAAEFCAQFNVVTAPGGGGGGEGGGEGEGEGGGEGGVADCSATVAASAASGRFEWTPTCAEATYPRYKIGHYLQARGLTGLAVEVGVQRGFNARALLDSCADCGPLVLVDPWEQQSEDLYVDSGNRAAGGHWGQDENLNTTLKIMAPHKGRYIVLRTYSVEAAASFLDESLDYVYLDGRHDYEGVKEDLEAWWPKLKVGGLLAGDDYNLDPSGIETIEMMDGGAKGAAGAGAGTGAGAAGSSPALAPTKFGVKRAFDDFFRARQRENKWLEGGFALGSWAYPQGLHQGRFSCNFGLHKV